MSVIDIDIKLRRDDFSLDVRCATDTRVTGLVGRSGAGKSTLLHALCGLVRPESGRIVLNDKVLFDTGARVNLPPEQRGIGVVFQDLRLFPHRSVEHNLHYGRSRAHRNGSPAVSFEHVVELLEIAPLLKRKPAKLSGGEKQRVALARALLSGPQLLLFDEPLAALDQRLKSQIIPLLRRVRDEFAVPMLYVCHDLAELQMMTESSIVMENGRAVGCGSLRTLAHQNDSFSAVHDLGLVNVLNCRVREQWYDDGITDLEIIPNRTGTGVRLRVPLTSHEKSDSVRAVVRPQDIALASSPIEATSIQNQLVGRITKLSQHGGRVLVEIDLGQPVLVEITPRASLSLQLVTGREVCCLIKSSAIEVVG